MIDFVTWFWEGVAGFYENDLVEHWSKKVGKLWNNKFNKNKWSNKCLIKCSLKFCHYFTKASQWAQTIFVNIHLAYPLSLSLKLYSLFTD